MRSTLEKPKIRCVLVGRSEIEISRYVSRSLPPLSHSLTLSPFQRLSVCVRASLCFSPYENVFFKKDSKMER